MDKMSKSTISAKVYFFRNERGLSQEALAKMSYTSIETIRHIEKGERIPDLKELVTICDALNIQPDDLITKKESDHFND